jgi:hypothetical protein
MALVQRLLAIVLLLATGLPLLSASLALGQGTEAGLPACCRRTGQHHCGMTMGERSAVADATRRFRAPQACCPFCPASVAAPHFNPLSMPPVAQAVFAAMVSHPAGTPQTESRWRVARERSRGKRGPPQLLS